MSQGWYHTIELPGGEVTPGHYDKRTTVDRIGFPTSLEGKRCLDVGTSDGFWAFLMEKRGAAEVVALDIDDPAEYDWPLPKPADPRRLANREPGPNKNFMRAHAALGSKVERVNCLVYDASPERLGGKFDFVFMGSLALHLRDPVGAWAAVRTCVADDGRFLSADSISIWQTLVSPTIPSTQLDADRIPRWFTPNLRGYHRMLTAAGFKIEKRGRPYFIPFGQGLGKPQWTRENLKRPSYLTFNLVLRHLGAPSAWALCRP